MSSTSANCDIISSTNVHYRLTLPRFRAIIPLKWPINGKKTLRIIISGGRMSTFQETIVDFLDHLQSAKSANTVRAYRRALNDFASWYASNRSINELA